MSTTRRIELLSRYRDAVLSHAYHLGPDHPDRPVLDRLIRELNEQIILLSRAPRARPPAWWSDSNRRIAILVALYLVFHVLGTIYLIIRDA